jgi:exosortase/archaeosortase family protein
MASSSRNYLASGRLNLRLRVRLVLWAVSSVILSAIFFRQFWVSLPGMLSPAQVLGQNEASPWGVLTLCFIVLWLKRKQVLNAMQPEPNLFFIPIGLAITVGAIIIPVSPDYLAFQVLLATLGLFTVFFGSGIKMPGILMVIYGFTISFPLLIQHFAQDAYTQTVIVPLNGFLNILGYPFYTNGQWLHLTDINGDVITVAVTVACAGPSTMGVFIAIFALMSLDMPLPPKKAAWLFLFGIAGTWLQNFIRVAMLMVVAYRLGENTMWAIHSWTIYLLFPLWYLLYIYIYFRQFGGPKYIATPGILASQGTEV